MEFLIFLFDLFLIITVVTGVVIILTALSTMFVSYCFAKSNIFEKSFLDKLNLIELSPKQTKLTNREIIDKMSNKMLAENILSKISCENCYICSICGSFCKDKNKSVCVNTWEVWLDKTSNVSSK